MLLKNRLEVFDLAYNRLCILNDNTQSGAKNIKENYKLNSVDKISFVLPLSSDKWQYVLNENLVKWKNEYYFIKVPHFTHNEGTKEVSVECHHLSNGLEGITCSALELIGYPADEMMQEVLVDTGWTVGTVDIPTEKFRSLMVKEQSAFTNLVKIAELFEARLTFNSVARTVDLSDKQINRNIQIRKGKNLQSVDIQYDTTEITTRLYAFGGDDPETGLEVNIMNVNPNNHSYVENFSYYLSQGYTQAYIDAHPELFRREMTWNATEYVDEQALYDDAVKKLETLCKPKVSCNVEGLDLAIFPEYFIESPQIGETIYIIDEDLNLIIDAKVIDIEKQSDKPLSLKITISNEVEYNSIVKQLIESSQTVSKVVNPNNEIRGQYIKEATITNLHITDLDAQKIKTGDLDADRIRVAVLDAVNARIGELTANNATIEILATNLINTINANITNAKIDSAQIKDLTVGEISVEELKANIIEALTVRIEELSVEDARIKQLGADLISAVNANIGIGKINSAQIGQLTASNIGAGLITSDMIKAGDITADRLSSIGAGARFTGFIEINKNQTGTTTNGTFAIGGFNTTDRSKVYNSTTTLTMTVSGTDYTFTSGRVVTDVTNKKANMLMYTTDKARFSTITALTGHCTNIFAVYRVGTQWYADDGSVGSDGKSGVAFTFSPTTDYIIGSFLPNPSTGAITNWTPFVNAETLINGSYFQTGTVDAQVLKAGSIKAGLGLFDNLTAFDATMIKIDAGAINVGTLDASKITVSNLKADSITAGSLTIDGDNLIHGTAFEDISKWVIDSSGWVLDTSTKLDTSNTLKIDRSGLSSDSSKNVYSEWIPISSGQSLVASIYSYTDNINTIDNGVYMYIEFYNSAKTTRVGLSTSTLIKPSSNSLWQKFVNSGVAPSGTAYARIRFYELRNGRIWVARPMLQRGSIASEWKPHTDEQISEGAIDNSKVAYGSLNGDRLITDAITARELSTQAVKTKVLDTDTMTAVSANISNLDTSQISTGTLDASRIIVGTTGQDIYNYTKNVSKVQTIDGRIDTLLHFDENLCATNGLNPNSNYCVTIRPNDGKFSGAVAIEDETTNLITNGDFEVDATGWVLSANMAVSSLKSYIGNQSLRFYSTIGVIQSTTYKVTVSPNTTYTLSIKLWNNLTAGNFYIDWMEYNSSNTLLIDGANTSSTTGGQKWENITKTFTTQATTSYINIRVVADGNAIGECFADCVQLEQKSFATSFVNGGRAKGVLDYNINLGTSYTIGFWFNPQVPNNYSTSVNWVLSARSGGNEIIMWKRTTEDVYRIRINLSTEIAFTNTEITQGAWHYITIVANGTTTKAYINGLYKSSINSVIPLTSFLLGRTDSVTGNNLFDEMLISKRVFTDNEIKALYDIQQPLFDPSPIINPPTPLAPTMTLL